MRLLSHTNWRAFILLYYYYYHYWVGYARRGVAFDMRISSRHFPKPTTCCDDGGSVVALALATFCGARALALLLFAQRRGGVDHFCVNCLRCANDQSQRNKRYTRGCTMPIGCDNKTKQKQSKLKLKWKLISNWNANPIQSDSQSEMRATTAALCDDRALAGIIRLRPKTERAAAERQSEAIEQRYEATRFEALFCRGGQSARRQSVCQCVCVCTLPQLSSCQ